MKIIIILLGLLIIASGSYLYVMIPDVLRDTNGENNQLHLPGIPLGEQCTGIACEAKTDITLPSLGMEKDINVPTPDSTLTDTVKKYPRYIDFVNPDGFLNSKPFKLADYIGKKIILIEFITYSCINCQRTFPYLQTWHETYKDDGLLVVGIHTPEFAYEQVKENVAAALLKEGITFPVVQDNDYQTWNAYGNRFWPHRYLIDIHGNVVFDHIGEGAYAETEKLIQLELELMNNKSN